MELIPVYQLCGQKVFDSLGRGTLGKLIRHYVVPEKLVTLIRNTFDSKAFRVARAGMLTDSFCADWSQIGLPPVTTTLGSTGW